MPKGRQSQKRPADVIGADALVERIGPIKRCGGSIGYFDSPKLRVTVTGKRAVVPKTIAREPPPNRSREAGS